MLPFRTERLANGITLRFFDRSNRYFGDYHRVYIEIHLSVALPTGTVAEVSHRERMAVPGAEVESVRDRLAEDFLRHTGRYLAQADYPARLAAAAAVRPLSPRR
jgi:hypothetical protein